MFCLQERAAQQPGGVSQQAEQQELNATATNAGTAGCLPAPLPPRTPTKAVSAAVAHLSPAQQQAGTQPRDAGPLRPISSQRYVTLNTSSQQVDAQLCHFQLTHRQDVDAPETKETHGHKTLLLGVCTCFTCCWFVPSCLLPTNLGWLLLGGVKLCCCPQVFTVHCVNAVCSVFLDRCAVSTQGADH